MEHKLLLEIERLARELTDSRGHSHTAECGARCAGYTNCNAALKGSAQCPTCKAEVPFEVDCENVVPCGADCEAMLDLDPWGDVDTALRQLELTLVQLDMARARAAESPVVELVKESAA